MKSEWIFILISNSVRIEHRLVAFPVALAMLIYSSISSLWNFIFIFFYTLVVLVIDFPND